MAADRIFDAVQARLGGVTEPFVAFEIDRAAEEFFVRSSAWMHTARVVLRAGKRDNILILPNPEARIVRLDYAGRGSQKLTPVPAFIEGVSGHYAQLLLPFTLRLNEPPLEDTPISVVMTLAPEALSALPDHLVTRHAEAITDAALARLYAIPLRPWSSVVLAAFHARRTTRAVSEASKEIRRGYGGPLWSFPSFA